jgi:glycosyltransferase involved in cell wall biosynthesis
MRLPLKTACIITQSVYDIDPRVRRKAEALVGAGFSVDVLALRPPDGKKCYTVAGVAVRTISLGKQRGSTLRYIYEYLAFFLWACLRVTLQMRRRQYLMVDINTLPDFLVFAAVFARWMGAKLVLDMHEITPEFYMSKYGIGEDSWKVRLVTYFERISFEFADHVITISDPVQAFLSRRGLDCARSTVIPNAADEARFAGAGGTLSMPNHHQPPAFLMMYHGTLTRIYGLDIAVEAFALVHQEMPGAEFWILGSGPEADALQKLVCALGLEDKVLFKGLVPSISIPEWLRMADVGVLPIRCDAFLDLAFPNKLPEFIVTDTTVVVSELKAIRHYFSHDAVAYFRPGSSSELSQQMLRLYRHPGLRSSLAKQAKKEYAPIRWNLMKERYLAMVEALTGAKRDVPETAGETVTQLVANGSSGSN